jgi:hypothetical protein
MPSFFMLLKYFLGTVRPEETQRVVSKGLYAPSRSYFETLLCSSSAQTAINIYR